MDVSFAFNKNAVKNKNLKQRNKEEETERN